MCPKIHTEKKEYESPEEVQVLKILISTGDSYFKIQSLKVGINRQPLFYLKSKRKDVILIEEMRIYILNTTRFYHEDFEEYPGAWFSCPVDFEEIKERLGVQSEEEIEIEDYELPFPLEGNTRLWEINALCRMILEMQGTPLYYEMDVVQKRWFPSFTEFIDHKDQIRYYPVQDGESLARYLVLEVQIFGEVHPDLMNHIDYAAIGRELEASENYLFTDNGIFYYR